jgi:hypothetical protein
MFVIGLVHSIMGEWLIFRRLRKGPFVPTQATPLLRESHVRIVWGSWHLVTCCGWGLAALLIWSGMPTVPATTRTMVMLVVGVTQVASALIVLVATRGKHPAWIVLLVAAALTFSA